MSDKKNAATDKKPAMCPMVCWFDPRQMMRTGVDVALSSIFGRHSDYRLTEALMTPSDGDVIWDSDDPIDPNEEHDEIYDYSNRKDDLWIDYISDTGSGWNPTYAVAYYATRPTLEFGSEETKRGDILVFGGDAVYPVANRKAYRERLKEPFKAAFRCIEPRPPHVFAVPGNHDWYDSLVSFTRLFCSRRKFAGWRTRQRRSYFALKLPHGWWLMGTDVQLDSDIDIPQVNYFRRVARMMQDGDRVILCTAEPHWVLAAKYEELDPEINEKNLEFLEERVFGEKRIAVYLSGDLHHYRRHENDEGIQKITAGGGGAHLAPTHGSNVEELAGGFRLRGVYPPEAESKKLTWKNLGFLFLNPWFGLFTAPLYLLVAWSVMANIGGFGISQIWPAVKLTIATALASPSAMFAILLVFGGFLLFTDTHSKRYRLVAGSLHGFIHLTATFLIGWAASYIGVTCLGLQFKHPKQLLVAAAIIFPLAWIVSSVLMGLYLLISLNVFGRHSDEAFGSLMIQDWKHFLRLHIDADGHLKIFPIGIRKVERHWVRAAAGASPEFEPRDKTKPELMPELIEEPIPIKFRPSA